MALSIMGCVREVPINELHLLPDPEPMGSRHCPIPHSQLMDLTRKAFNVNDMDIADPVVRLTEDNKKMLTTFDVVAIDEDTPKYQNETLKLIGIIANFQNQTGRVTIGAGTRVFACANETVDAEFKVTHKSTRNLENNIRNMIWDSCAQLDDIYERITGRQEFLQAQRVEPDRAAYCILDAAKRGVINSTEILKVEQMWQEPEQPEFRPRNYWSLYNAFSGFFQDRNPFDVADRSRRLNTQFEEISNLIIEDQQEMQCRFETLMDNENMIQNWQDAN